MRTQVMAALVAAGALLGGCYRAAEPDRRGPLTEATPQQSRDVAGPRVDPRTRAGGENVAGSIPDLAEGQAPVSVEPVRNHPPEEHRD